MGSNFNRCSWLHHDFFFTVKYVKLSSRPRKFPTVPSIQAALSFWISRLIFCRKNSTERCSPVYYVTKSPVLKRCLWPSVPILRWSQRQEGKRNESVVGSQKAIVGSLVSLRLFCYRSCLVGCFLEICWGQCLDASRVPSPIPSVAPCVNGHTIWSHLVVWWKSDWFADRREACRSERALKNVV